MTNEIRIDGFDAEIYVNGNFATAIHMADSDDLLFEVAKQLLIQCRNWKATLEKIRQWVDFQSKRLNLNKENGYTHVK